jgi:hypothetical protein
MFAILFCIGIVVGINGAWLKQPASINQDAVELAQLTQTFWSLAPAAMKRAKPLVYCQIIDQCCNDEDRTEAVSLIGQSIDGTDEGRFVQTMQKCMNSTNSNEGNQLCPSIVQSISQSYIFRKHPDVKKFFNILDQYDKPIAIVFDPVGSVCNSEEIHSLICSSKITFAEKCISKALRKIYDNKSHDYQKNVLDAKQAFTTINQQLSKAFISNANTE